MKALHAEICETLLKEIEGNKSSGKIFLTHRSKTTNIVKMSTLPKAVCIFNAIKFNLYKINFKNCLQVRLKNNKS